MFELFPSRNIDPFDIVWKNLFEHNAAFQTFEKKITYPSDTYVTPEGTFIELAAIGLDIEDIDISVEDNILQARTKADSNVEEKPTIGEDSSKIYVHRGIAKRAFSYAWKLSSKLDLTRVEATLDKGLLKIFIPFTEKTKEIHKIEIKAPKLLKW